MEAARNHTVFAPKITGNRGGDDRIYQSRVNACAIDWGSQMRKVLYTLFSGIARQARGMIGKGSEP